jgi:hypothetical protein
MTGLVITQYLLSCGKALQTYLSFMEADSSLGFSQNGSHFIQVNGGSTAATYISL